MRASTNSRGGLCLLALLACLAVASSETYSSLLLTSANVTGGAIQGKVYASCLIPDAPPFVSGPAFPLAQLEDVQVRASFWGEPSAAVSDFEVLSSCHSLDLVGQRSVQVYAGAAPLGCKVVAYEEDEEVLVAVTINNSSDSWTVTLPKFNTTYTKASCTARSSFGCPMSSQPSCNSFAEGNAPRTLTSFLATGESSPYLYNSVQSNASCPAGVYSGETMGSKDLAFGVKATYYQLDRCSQLVDPAAAYPLPDFSMLTPDPQTPTRCQEALDYEAYNTTWPAGPPALDAADYTGCFGAQLDGYVEVYNNSALQDLTFDHPAEYDHRFRVCLRFNGVASLSIGGKLLLAGAPDQGFDSVLDCVDTSLPLGLQPFHVNYAGTPQSRMSVLQLFIIPVSMVYSIYNRYPLKYGYTMLCDACSAFGGFGDLNAGCCLPVGTCSFRSDQCFPEPPVQAPSGVSLAPAMTPTGSLPPSFAPAPFLNSAMPPAVTLAPSAYGSAPAPSAGQASSAPKITPTLSPTGAAPPVAPAPRAYGSTPPSIAPAPSAYGAVPPTFGPAPAGYGSSSPAVAPAPYGYSSKPPVIAPAPYGYGSTPPVIAPAPHGYGSKPPVIAPAPYGYGSKPPVIAPAPAIAPGPYGYSSKPPVIAPAPAVAPAPYGYGSKPPAMAPAPGAGGSTPPVIARPPYGYGLAPASGGYGSSPIPAPEPTPSCNCPEATRLRSAIANAKSLQELKALLG